MTEKQLLLDIIKREGLCIVSAWMVKDIFPMKLSGGYVYPDGVIAGQLPYGPSPLEQMQAFAKEHDLTVEVDKESGWATFSPRHSQVNHPSRLSLP